MTLIEVGPTTVRGPGPVSPGLATAALDCIDDALALVDDQPLRVDELWSEVLGSAAGPDCDSLMLVCPTWWTADQVNRVRTVASATYGDVVTMRRVQALRAQAAATSCAVVEIAADLVLVSHGDGDPVALVRHRDDDVLVRAVSAAGQYVDEVVIDAPPEVPGAGPLGRAIAEQIRRQGFRVSVVRPGTLREENIVPRDEPAPDVVVGGTRGKLAASAVALVAVALCGVLAMSARTDAPSMTVLVEGRVGIQIPAGWTVQRITDGPGSARVQVVSPTEPDVAIHLTQSPLPDAPVADTLRRALDEQPDGVFLDFNADDHVAGRPVVSYREVRGERDIRWAVLVDGPVRIAIGCQNRRGRDELVQQACDAAIRSAHAVF